MAPLLNTTKKVPSMRLMMSVKLSAITCVGAKHNRQVLPLIANSKHKVAGVQSSVPMPFASLCGQVVHI